MRDPKFLLLTLPLLALAVGGARDAEACGGVFTPPVENEDTMVSGHRMVLSIAQQQTTLWDQIAYVGSPSSFAWVLPTKGPVDIGLSSDAMFAQLDALSAAFVNVPTPTCPAPPPGCVLPGVTDGSSAASGGGPSSGAGGAGGGGVTVIAQKTVGPYATVQLKATDPTALETWLAANGYSIPASVAPVIAAYQNEGFDFLALKLVPGANISAMVPVRVTSMGATPTLPLRMIAAGTGVTTPITLWVLGEGRYQPANFPSFTVSQSQLVWDWDTQSSNYAALRKQGYTASHGKAWLAEAANPLSKLDVSDPLTNLAMYDPMNSGYADAMGNGAVAACTADLAVLFGSIPDGSLWLTRLDAQLPRTSLVVDLEVGASPDQSALPTSLNATKTTGTPPCPDYSFCGAGGAGGAGSTGSNASGSGGKASSSSASGNANGGQAAGPGQAFGGCAVLPASDSRGSVTGLTVVGALLLARRRRR